VAGRCGVEMRAGHDLCPGAKRRFDSAHVVKLNRRWSLSKQRSLRAIPFIHPGSDVLKRMRKRSCGQSRQLVVNVHQVCCVCRRGVAATFDGVALKERPWQVALAPSLVECFCISV
jgi:hypothetical protein